MQDKDGVVHSKDARTAALWEIAGRVTGCTACGLCNTRTNAVPGSGTGRSGIIFVGEAPGRSEDLKGRPFVGAAGRILDEALREAGIPREDAYITNVVKCRPPSNRVPSKAEREACAGFLRSEIEVIRPKIVCIMGNTAYGSILGGESITKNRGKITKRDGIDYFVTIHPAAAIYNHKLDGVLRRDIKTLAELVSQ